MIERCAFCQADFTPRNNRVRCCSKLCGSRLYYLENKERIKAKCAEYANRNRDKVRKTKLDRYYKNREKLIQTQRDYRKRKAAERAVQRS